MHIVVCAIRSRFINHRATVMRLETKEEAHKRVERMKDKEQKTISNGKAWMGIWVITIVFWAIPVVMYIRS
jgi:hypothetical protein